MIGVDWSGGDVKETGVKSWSWDGIASDFRLESDVCGSSWLFPTS